MSKRAVTNVAHSVRDRLLSIARRDGIDFNLILSRYVVERFLYRLSRSKYRDRFVLKGAMLFAAWTGKPHRPTRDLDLLGLGDLSEASVRGIFQSVFEESVEPDGLVFDPDSIAVADIRAEEEYQGRRVKALAKLGTAKVFLQVDIGTGDAMVPPPQEISFPVLLDMPAPKLRAYARETVIAEKLQAMAALGMLNSRMKDLYDLWTMAQQFEFDGAVLTKAIGATFDQRSSAMADEVPAALTDEFAGDAAKQTQWRAFLRNHGLSGESSPPLEEIVPALRRFLELPYHAAGNQLVFTKHWTVRGPWQ